MKKLVSVTVSLLLAAKLLANSDETPASPPPLAVHVFAPNGKMVYHSKAGPNGIFETDALDAG